MVAYESNMFPVMQHVGKSLLESVFIFVSERIAELIETGSQDELKMHLHLICLLRSWFWIWPVQNLEDNHLSAVETSFQAMFSQFAYIWNIVVKCDTGALDWLTLKIMSKESCLNLAQFHLTALSVSLRPIMTIRMH